MICRWLREHKESLCFHIARFMSGALVSFFSG